MKIKPDNLSGVLSLYDKILKVNELADEAEAYKLSLSGANSGLSFGANQMDMSERKSARELFIKIMTNATDNKGNKFLKVDELNSINQIELSVKHQQPQTVFGNLLPKINEVLSSDYGITNINNEYINQIKADSVHIENIVINILNPFAKQFYNTNLGKCLLFDYNNQFYLSSIGKLKEYMDGRKIITYTGKILCVQNDFTMENHKRYMFNTKYGMENKKDIERRINNILNVTNNLTPKTL